MFTAICCTTIENRIETVKIFREGDHIDFFDTFLVNTDDSFGNLPLPWNGLFTAIKDGYYSFSFFGVELNENGAANFRQSVRIAVHVDGIPKVRFQNYETIEIEEIIGIDTISFAFNLKLNASQEVTLFLEKGQIYCGQMTNCVFNGRFVRPLIFELAIED